MYGVPTKALNRATRRNSDRFPEDFMFQLTEKETENLRSQFVSSNLRCQFGTSSYGGRRYLPYAFTEEGIAMLSSVLHSERAIQVNIAIMRAFVRFRKMIADNKELSKKIDLLENRVFKHDSDIRELVRDIRKLTIGKTGKKLNVGFKARSAI